MPTKVNDLTGSVFGRLTVQGLAYTSVSNTKDRTRKVYYWNCLCTCGNSVDVQTANLRTGDTKSCGCLKAESFISRVRTHGMSDTVEFIVWSGMMNRCYYKDGSAYTNYGGRGIFVTDRWHSFSNFLEDMGVRPNNKMTLERLDNDGPYAPDNCVWTTRTVQARNTRRTVWLTLDGVTRPMPEWSELLGISYYVIRARHSRGWTDRETLTTPLNNTRKVCL